MHRIFRVKAYEKEHGPHFNEEYARKAVMKMENEDGTRGPHWSLEETTTLASQYGIALGSKFNRYDWFVALNMVYSDYYRVIMNITGSNNTKHYVEFAKAWLNDKDIDEGKMWYYYIYVMCDHIREAEMECYEEKMSKYEDEEEDFGHYRRGGRRMGMFGRRSMYDKDDYENTRWSDFWLYDASFIRLKNVELAYTFPKSFVEKLKIQNLRLVLTGTNQLTFDKVKVQDPESDATSTGQKYPQARTYTFGVNVSF